MNYLKGVGTARLLLRIGLAFVYSYAAVEMYVSSQNLGKYVPVYVENFIQIDVFLMWFGIFEIALVLWLLSGKSTKYAGLVSFFVMTTIIMTNIGYFEILFRNVAIALSSLALFALGDANSKSYE